MTKNNDSIANQSINQPQEEESLKLRDFLSICLQKWKWFAFSIIVCVAIGCLYVLTAPKFFTVSASVMIKDDDKGGGGMSTVLADMGFGGTKAEVRNELIAFQSPALIGEVIENLDLQTNYTTKPRLREETLYGDSLPVRVEFLDILPTDEAAVVIDLDGKGGFSLSEFSYSAIKDKIPNKPITGRINDTISTPIGRLYISAGPDYRVRDNRKINVSRNTIANAISEYKGKLNMTLSDEKASVIDIVITDENIERGTDVIADLIKCYNTKWVDDKNQVATATSEFITNRLVVLEQELGEADKNVTDYQKAHLLPDLPTKTKIAMNTNAANEKVLTELAVELDITRSLRSLLANSAQAGKLLPMNAGIKSEALENMIEAYNTKQMECDNMESRGSSNNPRVEDMKHDLQGMRQALLASVDAHIQGITGEISRVANTDALSTAKVADAPEQAMQLLGFERERGIKQELYLFLLKKREENELSRAFTAYNTRIITPPMGPPDPTKPQKMVILMFSFLIGLLIPAFVIFAYESMNTRVRSRSDLEGLRTPYMGEIPLSEKMRRGRLRRTLKKIGKKFSSKRKREAISSPELVVKPKGRNMVNEAFRSLRTNLEFVTSHIKGTPVIMTTSFNPGSGKSFVTLNLAAAIAVKHQGSKVLVIDLDMRRGSMSGVVGNPGRGIADYLAGSSQDINQLIQPTTVDGLKIIPVGTVPPNPSELLYSPKLRQAIDELKEEFDYIFLDCAPTEIVTDASIITQLCDVTLFIVRAGLLDRRLLSRIDTYYDNHMFANLTVVLNGTSTADSPYGHSYSSHYYHQEDK